MAIGLCSNFNVVGNVVHMEAGYRSHHSIKDQPQRSSLRGQHTWHICRPILHCVSKNSPHSCDDNYVKS